MKPRSYKPLFNSFCFTLTLLLLSFSVNSSERQYNPAELSKGRQLFVDNCSICHGANAEGAKHWQQRDENGRFPPPPLNGSAHTWHHSVSALYRTINEGTIEIGGSMPAWKEKLSSDEILLIINWITSLWPDEIYQIWREQIADQ